MRKMKRVRTHMNRPKMTRKEHYIKDCHNERKELQFIKRQLINSKGNICALCGKPIEDKKDITIDHIIPLSKGGLTTFDNCQLAHFSCNQKKGNS